MIWQFLRKKNLANFWKKKIWRSDFQNFFLKKICRRSKIQNPARGQKSPSRGGGVDLNFRGVINFFFRGCSKFQKITDFYAKIA